MIQGRKRQQVAEYVKDEVGDRSVEIDELVEDVASEKSVAEQDVRKIVLGMINEGVFVEPEPGMVERLN